jgi:phage tail-like protein
MNVNGSRFELLLGRDDWGRCLDGDNEHARTLADWWDLLTTSSPSAQPDLPAWDAQHNEISILPLAIVLPPTPTEAPLDLSARRCACADRYGNVYRVGDDGRSLVIRPAANRRETVFWPAPPEACEDERRSVRLDFGPVRASDAARVETYRALAVTADHYLVVAYTRGADRGFLSFDLVAGGPPVPTIWPAAIALEVFDMAPRHGGGVWVLDRANRQLWELDCKLAVVRTGQASVTVAVEGLEDFQPLSGPPRERAAEVFPAGIDLDGSPPWVIDPIAVESIGDGVVLLLDIDEASSHWRVVRLRRDGVEWRAAASQWSHAHPVTTTNPGQSIPDLPHDFVYTTTFTYQNEQPEKQLLLVTRSGNQASAYRIVDQPDTFSLKGATELFPLRRFGGRALVSIKDRTHYDSGIEALVWTPIVQQPRALFGRSAVFVTPVFDSAEIGTTWDRVLVDACVPPDAAIEIMSRAGDERGDLADGVDSPDADAPQVIGTWIPEPAPYLRSSAELPWLRSDAIRPTRRERGVGTWELLLQQAHGRYLQLRIRLTSANGMSTPRLRALRAWSPRFSYPRRFLPGVYREDSTAGPFLERWLANMESTLTNIEDRVVNLQALFDPRVAPAEMLPWLASWFEVAFDPEWDEGRQRLFVRRTMDYFRWRGTVHGLRLALLLAFDPCIDEQLFDGPSPDVGPGQIRIVETYQTRLTGAIVAGDPGSAEPGPRLVRPGTLWIPEEGNAGLANRWAALFGRDATFLEQVTPFPLVRPADYPASQWTELFQTAFGFLPSIGALERARWRSFLLARHGVESDAVLPRDLPASDQERADWDAFNDISDGLLMRTRWHDFLARRYRRIERLNRAWQTNWPEFDEVALPDALPHTQAAQTDWLQFEGRLLAMHRTAHRFSVLLPVSDVTADPFELERRLALARRIVDLEKPAHTVFDVRYYWAFFRVGEARLGIDTQLGTGSRAPELIPDAVLGRAYVGASFVGGAARPDDGDRLLIAH